MAEPISRKHFLRRLQAGTAALLAGPFAHAAQAVANEPTTDQNDNDMPNPILDIKPMGFQWETADPFLFCVHHEDQFPKGNGQLGPAASLEGRNIGEDFILKDGWRMYHGKTVPGFPGHPHSGFETVTIVRKGLVDHADSLGAAGRYGNGDVQWMTAGKGVQHSEMFPVLKEDEENPLELFQIWLNLPRKHKGVAPYFEMFWREDIPNYQHEDAAGKQTQVEVIAGQLQDHKAPTPPPDSWATDPANEVAIWNIRMQAGAQWELPAASPGVNRTLYCYIGDGLSIAGQPISNYNAVKVHPDQALSIEAGQSEVRILLLQGRPIGEPVIQYGPFVANTKAEINEAFQAYHRTQFGGWPWPRPDQVHDAKLGRFAIYADGRKVVKA